TMVLVDRNQGCMTTVRLSSDKSAKIRFWLWQFKIKAWMFQEVIFGGKTHQSALTLLMLINLPELSDCGPRRSAGGIGCVNSLFLAMDLTGDMKGNGFILWHFLRNGRRVSAWARA